MKEKVTMTVTKGSGLNADWFEVRICRGDEELFKKKYWYGYDVSWIKFVPPEKDKPFEDDLFAELKEKYGVEEVIEKQGENLFKKSMMNKVMYD